MPVAATIGGMWSILRGNPVRIRLAAAAALLFAGSGGIVPTVVAGAVVAAPATVEWCDGRPTGGATMFSPGEGGALAPPLDPLDVELGGVVGAEAAAAGAQLTATAVPVWFHVITDGALTDVDDARIAGQLALLNESFRGSQISAPTPFEFIHAGTDRTDNPAWYGSEFVAGSDAERAAKTALRRGGAETLNVYVTRTATGASWGAFPWRYKSDPAMDGIVVNGSNFAGGTSLTNGAGDITVHEVGHWLGLWHTFQGGCTGGDYVDDTPAHVEDALRECITPHDTCSLPGTDPVHNFMNYVMDSCTDRFTAGQSDRMKAQWTQYRAPSAGGGGGGKPGRGNGRK